MVEAVAPEVWIEMGGGYWHWPQRQLAYCLVLALLYWVVRAEHLFVAAQYRFDFQTALLFLVFARAEDRGNALELSGAAAAECEKGC